MTISVFQIEVAPGEDEAIFDELMEKSLPDIVNTQVNRVGLLTVLYVLKGDVEGSTNRYMVIAQTDGLGFPFSRVFKPVSFPASLKVTELGSYVQSAIWPNIAARIE
jgi:hypothetical protein